MVETLALTKDKKNRAFLKWAGGKYSLIEDINAKLPEAKKLIEPFVGAGSVFLNTNYSKYLLNDINPDLINLYNIVKHQAADYITDSAKLFRPSMSVKGRLASMGVTNQHAAIQALPVVDCAQRKQLTNASYVYGTPSRRDPPNSGRKGTSI